MKKGLTDLEKSVIIDKGTEAPFTGKYCDFNENGTYTCRQCGALLYSSMDKFDSGCGWPSFDNEISGAVKRSPDLDGKRTEITCAKCGGHLGHVFEGENFTPKNTRHCVNSLSLDFIPNNKTEAGSTEVENNQKPQSEKAYFAGGCFWGVEYFMQQQYGVTSTTSGYMGGRTEYPTYEQVSTGRTGHAETVEVIFNPAKISFFTLAKLFFEIHDPTQKNGQGPDLGNQYRSEIFYTTPEQKATAEKLIEILREQGYNVSTKVSSASEFWPAESYHQEYFHRKDTLPYCHRRDKRFQ